MFVKTTPKPKATKNNKGELVGPPLPPPPDVVEDDNGGGVEATAEDEAGEAPLEDVVDGFAPRLRGWLN